MSRVMERAPLAFIGVFAALVAMALVPSSWAMLPLAVAALCLLGLGLSLLWGLLWDLGWIDYRENHIPDETPAAQDPDVPRVKPLLGPNDEIEFWIAYSLTAFGIGDTRESAIENWQQTYDAQRQMWMVD